MSGESHGSGRHAFDKRGFEALGLDGRGVDWRALGKRGAEKLGFSERGLLKAFDVLRTSRSVVAFTGAGISTDSGIPDFRGPDGVWTRTPDAERVSNLRDYLTDPEIRKRAWQNRVRGAARMAAPNSAHLALAAAAAEGWLRAVITQNTDGLHLAAGHKPGTVMEVHGSSRRWKCDMCGAGGPLTEMLVRVEAGEPDPTCHYCGGITRASVILFGEDLDNEVMESAADAVMDCDVLLAIGTTLQVYPVAGLVPFAVELGARLVIVNRDPTPYDHLADAIVRIPIGDALPKLIAECLKLRI